MDNREEEIIKMLTRINLRRNDFVDDDKYALCEPNALRFFKLLDYCETLAAKNNGVINNILTQSVSLPAEIQLRFSGNLIFGGEENDLRELSDVLRICDGINISGTGLESGTFLVSFFVTDLYVPKNPTA